ncbi:MAG: RNA polymerase sigma factor [Planctomycetota bacterium]
MGHEQKGKQSVQKSKPTGFDDLFELYHDAVFRQILIQVRDPGMAEDVAQETWLRIARKLESFEGRSGFFSWACSIASNEAKRNWSRIRKVQPIETEPEHDPATFREKEEAVMTALQKVPEDFRQPLLLELWEGWSIKEIGETLDLPEGTVKSRLHRGREKFREIWLQMNPEE